MDFLLEDQTRGLVDLLAELARSAWVRLTIIIPSCRQLIVNRILLGLGLLFELLELVDDPEESGFVRLVSDDHTDDEADEQRELGEVHCVVSVSRLDFSVDNYLGTHVPAAEVASDGHGEVDEQRDEGRPEDKLITVRVPC